MRFPALLIFVALLTFSRVNAQYGYSPLVDSIVSSVSDSSLSLFDRQLSGDTTVVITGVTDSIRTRHSNYPGNHKAARFILETFQSYGLSASYQHYDDNGYNVVAAKTGVLYPNEQFIICAHYDDMPSGPVAPGADDNGSGTSAVLEVARVLSQYTFDYTIKFIAFDEEEQGMIGSRAYADTAYKYGDIIRGVINLDMIGWDSNNDYEISVSSNTASMPLMESFTDILRLYQPQISPHLIIITNSDHSSFWNKGYQALLAIEEYPGDFLPYYHTVNDVFAYINGNFFLAVTRGAIAAIATMASGYRMTMAHTPLASSRMTGDRNVNLVVTGAPGIGAGENQPRLYYRIENEPFDYINPFQVSGDTLKFAIPGQAPGSKVSYYFAVEDSAGNYCVTLPESGKGINPPGEIPPPSLFSYYILNDTVVNACATGLPMALPIYQTVYKSVNMPYTGRILDLDVTVSLSHSNDKDINLYLVSPSGRQVMLSTKNGTTLDHYTSTVFDDEASLYINQGVPPFTGAYRPEQPLAQFDDTITNGNWSLKIVNAGGIQGSLTNLCIAFTCAAGDYYVDASRPVSGNGRSWATAFKTISEAASLEPSAGKLVLVKPGTYHEAVTITGSGQAVVPLKTGVAVSDSTKIQFPQGTNLSGIDLINDPGEYYAAVYRSITDNNGYFQVTGVNDALDYILVDNEGFAGESGVQGDSSKLSCCVFRPVIYRKCAPDAGSGNVLINVSDIPGVRQALYIGLPVGDGINDAYPARYNVIEGFDLSGLSEGDGVHIQSSSFNFLLCNSIHDFGLNGVIIRGNTFHPAKYNMLIENNLYEISGEAVDIGEQLDPNLINKTMMSHIIANEFNTESASSSSIIENAIDIKNGSKGTVVSRNSIHDFTLSSSNEGILEINPDANYTLVSGNIIFDIDHQNTGIHPVIGIHDHCNNFCFINNIIYKTGETADDMYAFFINGSGHVSSYLAFNTIYNINNAFLLEDYGPVPDFSLVNNIVYVSDEFFMNWGEPGRFTLSNNLYPVNPTPDTGMAYYEEEGRQVGEIGFANALNGDYRLLITSDLAICNGKNLFSKFPFDFSGVQRDNLKPDLGAFELEKKWRWAGPVNQDWSNDGNWSPGQVPGNEANVVILPSPYSPAINLEQVIVRGLLIKPGASLNILPGKILEQRN